MATMIDHLLSVENHGTIVLLRPLTHEALEWLVEHTDEDATWWGGALAVAPRYVDPILEGFAEAFATPKES